MSAIRFSTRTPRDGTVTRTQCAIAAVADDRALNPGLEALDRDSGGLLAAALKSGDFKAEAGDTLMLTSPGSARRVLLVGVGKGGERDSLRKAIDGLARALLTSQAADAQCYGGDVPGAGEDWEWFCSTLARRLCYHRYRYRSTLSKPAPAPKLTRFTLLCDDAARARTAKGALDSGLHTGEGVNLARELANLPGNHCTPEHLAKTARRLARGNDKASCQVLNEKAMRELGMGALLSVTAGSAVPARLIVLEYRGGKRNQRPQVLVGKGITFDSGGISLKPGPKMDEMKFDMGGAASVLGTLQAVMDMQLPLNVVGIVAAAENLPSGTATKPGDVVTAMSGTTIEILNTDAEGRLVLCDALTYAARFKPDTVIDIATLTGACVVALGEHASGLYANDEELAAQLLAAGEHSHDRAWRLPLWEDYQKQLKSNFADVANIGGPGAGSITAACFLARFTRDYRWAHMDIAGTAWDQSPKGATGRPVSLLTQYLCDRAAG